MGIQWKTTGGRLWSRGRNWKAVRQIDSTRVEDAYKLTENVKNDGHHRKRGESDDEFDVGDTREAREGEAFGEDCCQVSCHCEEGEDKSTRPKYEGYKTGRLIVPLLHTSWCTPNKIEVSDDEARDRTMKFRGIIFHE